MASPAAVYARRRPEETTLYKVVQDNLATLYGAVDDNALAIRLPGFVRKELEGYLDCGLLCRGFARVQCGACSEKRLVAFGCGGRGFCPSCLGRRMAETALNLAQCLVPALCTSAASGTSPPAGPELRRKGTPLGPLAGKALQFDKPLCASVDGFTLHAATRAGGLDVRAREALLKDILRPAVSQERITRRADRLVRIDLKKAFSDGTTAIELDPLSLLSRLCAAVPSPRRHTVRYAGVLASASKLRPRIAPTHAEASPGPAPEPDASEPRRSPYWPWAELLRRTFGIDVLHCPRCAGRLRLVAMVTAPDEVTRYLRALGEPTDLPARAPARGPPYWASRVLRRAAGAEDAAAE